MENADKKDRTMKRISGNLIKEDNSMDMNMVSANYSSFLEQTKKESKQVKDGNPSKTETPEDIKNAARTNGTSKTNEAKLSSKAQEFLNNLRKKYGNYDIFVGNSADDLKALAKSGTKEISVIFSNAELERMAGDEKYAKEKLQGMEQAVKMSEEIDRQFGFQSAFGQNGMSDVGINKISFVFQEDGTMTIFAELEKSSAKQRERIEKSQEKKHAQKSEEDRKAKKEIQNYANTSTDAKYTTIEAGSMEELLQKISAVDWNAIKPEKISEAGRKFDFSI